MAYRFPYEKSRWGQSDADRQHWTEGLERFGTEFVRARLAQDNRRAEETIHLTDNLTPQIGFAVEWLKGHDDERERIETLSQERMIEAAQGSMKAAEAAARAARLSLFVAFLALITSGFQAYYAAKQANQQTQTISSKPAGP
jgi:cytochrome b561